MRQVKITEKVLRDGPHVYHEGDVKSVDDAKAAQWIKLGWAADAQTGETGERKPGAHKLDVHDVQQKQS